MREEGTSVDLKSETAVRRSEILDRLRTLDRERRFRRWGFVGIPALGVAMHMDGFFDPSFFSIVAVTVVSLGILGRDGRRDVVERKELSTELRALSGKEPNASQHRGCRGSPPGGASGRPREVIRNKG